MTFTIDVGRYAPEIERQSAMVDEGQIVRFVSYTRAQAVFRKIRANIEAFEDPDMLDSYIAGESLVLDGLHLFDPAMAEELTELAEMHRAHLVHGLASEAARSASADASQSPTATPRVAEAAPTTKGKVTMFDIDTGSTGAEGPFISWTARGTQDGEIPPKSFYLRMEGGARKKLDAFTTTGVVMDLDSLHLGWQKSEGISGVAPEWVWAEIPTKMPPQPSDQHKRGFRVRCAIGKGESATWEQASAAVWNSLLGLIPALKERPTSDVLPLVKLTGTKDIKFTRGSTAEPVLEVVKWVPRPDSLKEGFAVDTAEQAPAPAPKAAPQPVAEPEDAPW